MKVFGGLRCLAVLAVVAGCAERPVGEWQLQMVCPESSAAGEGRFGGRAVATEREPGIFEGTLVSEAGGTGTFRAFAQEGGMLVDVNWQDGSQSTGTYVYDPATDSYSGQSSDGCAVTVLRPAAG